MTTQDREVLTLITGYANITLLIGSNMSDGRSQQAQTPIGRTWGLFKECHRKRSSSPKVKPSMTG